MDYRSTWNTNNIMSGDVSVIVNRWVEIGEYVVEAGLYYTPGWGFSTSQSDADGRIYAKFIDDTAGNVTEETGVLRVVAYTPDDMPIGVLFESRTESLNSSATDRTKQMPFPKLPIKLGLNYKYKFFFKSDASDILQKAYCVILIDITKQSRAS